MISGSHVPNIFNEILDPFHQIDQDPEKKCMEGIRSYYFMGFTMGYMPECVVLIFDNVRFHLFHVGIVISSGIPGDGPVSYGVSGSSPNS